jgi:hypothetical protein
LWIVPVVARFTHFRSQMTGREMYLNPVGTNPVANRFYAQRQLFMMGQEPLFLLKFDRNRTECNTREGGQIPFQPIG